MPGIVEKAPPQNPNLSFDELYRQAEEANPLLEKTGNKILDDVRERYPGKFDDAYLEIAPTKDKSRAMAKIEGDYQGQHSEITDLTRGRIVVKTAEQAQLLRQYMGEQKEALNVQTMKDRFGKPTDTGFRDILTTIKTENGHVAEFRVEQADMVEAGKLTRKIHFG